MAGVCVTDVVSIDLPYIERNVTRHGKAPYYLRIDGKHVCRLHEPFGTEAFQREYWAARKAYKPDNAADIATPQILSKIVKPNTFRWLCIEYMASNAITALDVSTQDRLWNIIEAMWLVPLSASDGPLFADMPLTAMDVSNLEVLRDRKKENPFAADKRLKTLRQVFDPKKDGKPVVANIARLVEPFWPHSNGHETATPENLASPRTWCERAWQRTSRTRRRPTACLRPCLAGKMGKRRRFTHEMPSAPASQDKVSRESNGMETMIFC